MTAGVTPYAAGDDAGCQHARLLAVSIFSASLSRSFHHFRWFVISTVDGVRFRVIFVIKCPREGGAYHIHRSMPHERCRARVHEMIRAFG